MVVEFTFALEFTFSSQQDGIVRIEVGEGTYKPYYLKSKGLKSTGVYVRQGASSVPASQEQIRLMIKNADGGTFETFRSLNQELTKAAALREALLNALVHRDYNYSGSIIININTDEIEFISIGGLLPGISREDIQNGISLPRNPKLAEVFHRLRFIESYGTGIRRIFTLYKNCLRQPEISVTPNSFKIILPNMNATNGVISEEKSFYNQRKTLKITKQMENILEYLSDNGVMTFENVRELLGVKDTRAYIIMKDLIDAGLVRVTGRGKDKQYRRR